MLKERLPVGLAFCPGFHTAARHLAEERVNRPRRFGARANGPGKDDEVMFTPPRALVGFTVASDAVQSVACAELCKRSHKRRGKIPVHGR